MKRTKFISVFLSVILLLCSCQETPDQVKENMKEYGDNSQMETSEITYCSPDDLKKSEMPETTGTSLRFPETVDFSGVETVELLHLSIEKDFLEDSNVSKYTELFGIRKDKMQAQEAGESIWGARLFYDSTKQQRYLNLMENGGMSYLAGLSYENYSNEVEAAYNVDRDDVSGVEVELTDGKIDLASLCQKTEQWMNGNMPVEGFSYKISDICVRKATEVEESWRTLSMCAEYDYKGIRLNDHTPPMEKEESDFSIKQITTFLAVQLDFEKDSIPSFLSRNLNVVLDSSEPIERIVDLDSAVRIMKEKMSGFGVFNISQVIPLYVLYLEDNAEAPGAGIEARPVYAFIVGKKAEYDSTGIIKIKDCEHFFYVDMITGELITDLDLNRGD